MPRLAIALLAFAMLGVPGVPAEARSRGPLPPDLGRLDARATDCFADAIRSRPDALRAAGAGRWYEAAGVAGYLCRPEVADMMRARDAAARRHGAGMRHFRTTYVRRLEGELARRLGAEVAGTAGTPAYADASPREEAGGEAR